MKRIMGFIVCLIAVLPVLFSVPASASAQETKTLKMATTTSTEDTGLLDYLKPLFSKETGIDLQWVATGSGKALKLGENCDADVLLVHAPDAEKKFTADGFGVKRREIMYNDFVVIGPESDPAGIKGKSVKESLAAIKDKKAFFVSRGDNSGTHQTELTLWKNAGIPLPDKESWYVQAGQGMLATISIAAERNGYTLTDRGTYIKYENNSKGSPALKIIVEGDESLKNQYSVIAVNPEKCKNAKYDLAMKFSDWMASSSTQQFIKDFKLSGKPLFFPNAKTEK